MKNFTNNYQPPQSLVLRFMREKKKLTLLYVGAQIGIKPKFIDHIEKGKRPVSHEEIMLFLKLYNFSLKTFNIMIAIEPLNKQTTNHYFLTNKD